MSALRKTITELASVTRNLSEKGKSWGPTAAAWGGSAALVGLFLTDWRVITDYIPYYKDKYNHEVPR